MFENYIIHEQITLLEALKQINAIKSGPLVLFVVNNNGQMVGTLTDGDSRRALISGAKVTDPILKIMHKDFNFLRKGYNDDVFHIKEQKEKKMHLVPILDVENKIIDIINLERYKSRLPIDAVLMAGGKGVRLRPLTEKTPKPLLPVGDKPIIDYNIESLISFGIKHISVTVNYLREQLEQHFENPIGEVKVECVREPDFLGTIGATQFVGKYYNDTILVMNSDLFTNIDLEDFYLHFINNNADISVAAMPYSVTVPYGIFELEGRNIMGVKEKPVFDFFANAGIYLIKRSILENIPKNVVYNATDLIGDAVKDGKNVIRYPITGYWLDIGNHSEYQKAQDLVKHI